MLESTAESTPNQTQKKPKKPKKQSNRVKSKACHENTTSLQRPLKAYSTDPYETRTHGQGHAYVVRCMAHQGTRIPSGQYWTGPWGAGGLSHLFYLSVHFVVVFCFAKFFECFAIGSGLFQTIFLAKFSNINMAR